MPPGARVCAPNTSFPANRVGTSVQMNTTNPVPVTWFLEDTDSNEDELPNADIVVASAVSDVVEPEDGGSILGCVANTSSATVSVTFQLCRDFWRGYLHPVIDHSHSACGAEVRSAGRDANSFAVFRLRTSRRLRRCPPHVPFQGCDAEWFQRTTRTWKATACEVGLG
jgi:hypothetical protein